MTGEAVSCLRGNDGGGRLDVVKYLLQVGGQGGNKLARVVVFQFGQSQFVSVQEEALQAGGAQGFVEFAIAVFFISGQGVAYGVCMNPDLMGPAGGGADSDTGGIVITADSDKFGQRGFACIINYAAPFTVFAPVTP